MIDLVGFDLSPDLSSFEISVPIVGIFDRANIQICGFRSIGHNWWFTCQSFTILPLTKSVRCGQVV